VIDASGFQPADAIVGGDKEDTEQLQAQYREAREYIRAFSWSEPLDRAYFAFGVGEIFALFLFILKKPLVGPTRPYGW